ncbi:lantibiotic immunity ABC transporter MutG family permease subunit [Aedoeadaptatus nemausensis]|nr:lantibiotic immunity ABC transporter MutG family permease subunit [Peptoniphilus nemausensis]
MMLNIIKSELYKMKHTWLVWVHIVLPIAYSVFFYVASITTSLKNYEKNDMVQTYFVILGAMLPIVCSFITFKAVDMEASAGNFQVLLSTTKSRTKAYLGKLIVMELGFIVSLTWAVIIFAALSGYQHALDWIIELFLIFISSIALYIIHTWIGFASSSGASIGLGFIETMISLLLMTILGDNIWYFIPCTWPTRFPATFIMMRNVLDSSYFYREIRLWSFVATLMILILLISSIIWFNKWDGKTAGD